MLTRVSQPAVEPVSLAEAKAHLRVDIDDDDLLIASLVRAAREMCESRIDRSFITTTWRMSGDNFPGRGLLYESRSGWIPERFLAGTCGGFAAPIARLIAVTSITHLDASGTRLTIDPAAYSVTPGDGGMIIPAYQTAWPYARHYAGSVEVEFTAGYGDSADDVPACIKAAILLMVGNLYENRESTIVGMTVAAELPGGVSALLAAESWGQYP